MLLHNFICFLQFKVTFSSIREQIKVHVKLHLGGELHRSEITNCPKRTEN